jgi:hypothetical protein
MTMPCGAHWHKHGILRRQDIRNVVTGAGRDAPCAGHPGKERPTMSAYDRRDPDIVADGKAG